APGSRQPFSFAYASDSRSGYGGGERNIYGTNADGFPYETHSGEAVFAQMFVSPLNGPHSEDGTKYDPDPYRRGDFPSYSENVYHYRYGNMAMVVLNSDYWYAPLLKKTRPFGGRRYLCRRAR
ncbi:MAG: hypothetical protein LH618_02090, partial [Saprospiraceae bacterium]|nr:hypothetical protein [Saprospiraceae bacterium]